MVVFLIVLHLVSSFFYGFGVDALLPVAIAVLTTTLLDLFIEYFKSKTWMFPQSALISGLFIGGLLTQNLQWHVYMIAGAIAIISKHIIKINQKHIFNPANLGILLVSIIFGVSHTWWISSPKILVLIFGIFIIWRLKRFDLALSFLASYYIINSIILLFRGMGLSDVYYPIINGGVIYFFSMYMLIEPRTHPNQRKQRLAYGILVAVLLILIDQYALNYRNMLAAFFIRHDLPLALAVGNIFVPVLNRLKLEFKKNNPKPSITETLKMENY